MPAARHGAERSGFTSTFRHGPDVCAAGRELSVGWGFESFLDVFVLGF